MKAFNNKQAKGFKSKTIQSEILLGVIPLILISMIILSGLGYYTAHEIIERQIGKEREKSIAVAMETISKSLAENRKVAEVYICMQNNNLEMK